MRRLNFTGSLIGGIADTQEVLDLCAAHSCAPEVAVLPLAEVNKALVRARYFYTLSAFCVLGCCLSAFNPERLTIH
jgi:D-arabinose 1-dehydrogenase-like Zn-dependent alcohol dehydrogenase